VASMTDNKVVQIPLDDIVESRWSTGIRNKEIYEQTKKNIQINGLNNYPRVFPLGNGKYEVYIGDHRIKILKELHQSGQWGNTAPVFMDNITSEEAFEKCVADNICRAGYKPAELENKITEMFKSGRYKTYIQLGDVVGFTGQRVGQLIGANEDRERLNKLSSKGPFEVSTQVIIDSKILKDTDRVLLLQLVQTGKVKPSDTQMVAKLCKDDEKLKDQILRKGLPYERVLAEHQNAVDKAMKKKTTKTFTIQQPDYTRGLYDTISKSLQTYLIKLGDSKEKTTAINYLRMTVACMLQTLYKESAISEDQFKQVKKDILHIYRDNLQDYKGESLKGDIDFFLK
jgi:ParB-like chromosome segregation protein Spo0J